MTHINRLIYAFFMSVVVVGIMTVVCMISGWDIGSVIFSKIFFIPIFVISYLLAPLLGKYIKFQ